MKIRPTIDSNELNTILAALRYWQQGIERDAIEEPFERIATDGGTRVALGPEAIDGLCEYLNCAPTWHDPKAAK